VERGQGDGTVIDIQLNPEIFGHFERVCSRALIQMQSRAVVTAAFALTGILVCFFHIFVFSFF